MHGSARLEEWLVLDQMLSKVFHCITDQHLRNGKNLSQRSLELGGHLAQDGR